VSISLKLITNRIGFESHVATVRDYLNWYRKANSGERNERSPLFGQYIISACWHKMERRIGHWAAVGLMYDMSRVPDEWLSSLTIDGDAPATENSDFRLSMYILHTEKAGYLKEILSYHKYDIPSDATLSDLPKGDSTKMKIDVLPCLQELSHKGSDDLYNEKTVVEFHHLLVATLLCYAATLRKLRKAYEMLRKEEARNTKAEKGMLRKKAKLGKDEARKSKAAFKTQHDSKELDLQDTMATFNRFATKAAVVEEREEEEEKQEEKQMEEEKDQELSENSTSAPELNTTPSSPDEAMPSVDDAAREVLFISRLLNTIVGSGAFQRHIKLLVEKNFLRMPSDQGQQDFYKFAQIKDIPWQQSRKTQTGVLQNPSGGDGRGNPDFGGTASSREGSLERDQDPFQIFHKEEIIMAIQGWVKIFVQHLHSKSILESFARHGGKETPIEIKIYGLCLPEESLLLPTWDALMTVIRSSLQDKSVEEQENMVQVFRSHFQTSAIVNDDNAATAQTDGDNLSSKNHIFNVISDIITGKAMRRSRYYNMHCEAALAGLVALSESPEKVAPYADKEIIAELQVGLVHSI
jgi:hypothetical protein